ncbi:uncharacterized protein LOC114274588 [Camellia sinensis]|uniref:uncharacterized protein LOC114274588 n=1 Tax=Camellia sinensis TaxID=4442 RepID=UPI001035D779|nr:uncharacterized protein LOC114274588 [Camellia sinensis]
MQMPVLVNGSPASSFPTYRGLPQGDHLSPLLFILVMEALGSSLSRAVQGGLLQGFAVGVDLTVLTVSHLFYVNDALIFCGVDVDQIGYLRFVFLCFEVVLVLRVNLAKSELILVGKVARIPVLEAILGCKVASLPVSYLGLPFGASFKAKWVWKEVMERMQWRLTRWKQQYLSKGSRLLLIKSVLSSIPTYLCLSM